MTLDQVTEVDMQMDDDFGNYYGEILDDSLCYYSHHPGALSRVLTPECESVGKDDL